MSNNKKIVSILFSVTVLFSGVQVSALTLRQLNPISWNIGSKLSALKIGFPQFLKGWKAEGKSVGIEMQDLSLPQETVEEAPRQGFFSKLFGRFCFRRPRINLKDRFMRLFASKGLERNKKTSEYFSSVFPEVDLQSVPIYQNEVDFSPEPGELIDDIVALNAEAKHCTNLKEEQIVASEQSPGAHHALQMVRRNPNGDKIQFPGYGQN